MGLIVHWTDFAKSQLRNIFDYHKQNVSSGIAAKISTQIVEKAENLSDFPRIGEIEEHLKDRPQKLRYIISTNYKIIYWFNSEKNRIEIMDVFDVRQNPKKIERNKL